MPYFQHAQTGERREWRTDNEEIIRRLARMGWVQVAAPATVDPDEAPDDPPEDLTVIRGIGAKTQADLHAQGITRLATLAAADPADLAGRLNGSTAAQVADWIAQARGMG